MSGDQEDGAVAGKGGRAKLGDGIAFFVEMGIGKAEEMEELEDGLGARVFGEGWRGDRDQMQEPLTELGLVQMKPVEGAMDRRGGGEGGDATLGAGDGVGGGWGHG